MGDYLVSLLFIAGGAAFIGFVMWRSQGDDDLSADGEKDSEAGDGDSGSDGGGD